LKASKKVLLMLTTVLIGLSLISGGCAGTANKPAQPLPGAPSSNIPVPGAGDPTPDNMSIPNSPESTYPKEIADRAATEAGKVSGVENATAIVSGQVIYIGLDLKSNPDKNMSAKIEEDVMNKTKNLQPNYTITVSSDADAVNRIKQVAQGVEQGQPLSNFITEMENIARLTTK
jgi:YhcN/YlaJ family sporulation lipoprotein